MIRLTPHRITANDPNLPAVHALIRRAFAYMDGVVDPPSSMHLMTLQSLKHQTKTSEIWALGKPPRACVILTPQSDTLYLGKLACDARDQGRGYARCLVDFACERARALHLPSVTLQTRIELTTNHAIFKTLGFSEIARTRHAGYDRDTSITFRRDVTAPPT